MAGTGTKRIIELTEASTIQNGDFIAVDSTARGTKKVSTDTLATSAALTAETNARTGADEQMSERMDGIEEQTALIQNPTKTLSGALCSFTDGADMPMVACTAEIVPKQSGTGTPSPDNVRAISGWESVSVYESGKNLLEPSILASRTSAGVTVTASTTEPIVSFSGTTSAVFNYYLCPNGGNVTKANAGYVLPAGTYTFSARKSDGSALGLDGTIGMFYWVGESETRQIVQDNNNTATSVTLTATDTVFITPTIGANSGKATNFDVYFQLELGTTATAYEPYNGTTKTVNLGRTVYGGTLDVVSGVLTVDRVMVDLGTLNWQYNGSSPYKWFYTSSLASTIKPVATNLDKANMLSPIYEVTTRAAVGADESKDYAIWLDRDKYIGVRDSRYTSAAAFKSAMSGVQLVYELANPQTYTLTGQEISTLLGENNVWADSGDIEITYRRDISIVLENLENALSGSNSLNTMMMSAPTENTAEEPTEDEAEDDMR